VSLWTNNRSSRKNPAKSGVFSCNRVAAEGRFPDPLPPATGTSLRGLDEFRPMADMVFARCRLCGIR
jgi:hypothetical protein